MFPIKHGGYYITKPINSGGKAGKGRNKTSTIRVEGKIMPYGVQVIIKTFRHDSFSDKARMEAVKKAKKYIDDGLPGSDKDGLVFAPCYEVDCNPFNDINISDYAGK